MVIVISDALIDFFIGGNINEPVSLEIPFQLDNPSDLPKLATFLKSYGLDIDANGERLNAISLTKKQDWRQRFSLITPALKPEDIKPMFRLLETLFAEFRKITSPRVTVYYPHILDLNNLLQDKDQPEDDGTIESLLQQAEQSEDLIVCSSTQDLRKIGSKDNIFGGAAMSDPYVVATDDYAKYSRYVSSDITYAAEYSYVFGWTKNGQTSFINRLPNGEKIGFLHEYESRPNQLFFGNADIENLQSGSLARFPQSETMINRFNNPVVATYVMWQKPNDPKVYIFKIPENDEQWKKLIEYYSARRHDSEDQAKINKMNGWIQEGTTHETFIPSTAKHETASDLYKSIQKKIQDDKDKQKQEALAKQKVIDRIGELLRKIDEFKTEASKHICQSVNSTGDFEYQEKYQQDILGFIPPIKQIISELENIKHEMETIKQEHPDLMSTDPAKVDEVLKIYKKYLNLVEEYTKNSQSCQRLFVSGLLESPQEIFKQRETLGFKCKTILFDEASKKIKATNKDVVERVAQLIVFIYISMSGEERDQIQDKIQYIKENASKEMLKQLIKTGRSYGKTEFAESLKTPFIEKITSIFRFKKGKEKLTPQRSLSDEQGRSI